MSELTPWVLGRPFNGALHDAIFFSRSPGHAFETLRVNSKINAFTTWMQGGGSTAGTPCVLDCCAALRHWVLRHEDSAQLLET